MVGILQETCSTPTAPLRLVSGHPPRCASLETAPWPKPRLPRSALPLSPFYVVPSPLCASVSVCVSVACLSLSRDSEGCVRAEAATTNLLTYRRHSNTLALGSVCFFSCSCKVPAGGLAAGPSLNSRWGGSDDVTCPGHLCHVGRSTEGGAWGAAHYWAGSALGWALAPG